MDFVALLIFDSSAFILLRDLNFHLEACTDPNTAALLEDLGNLGLTQHVKGPIHSARHLLGPIFTTFNNITVDKPRPITWTHHTLHKFTIPVPHRHRTATARPARRDWNNIAEEDWMAKLAEHQPEYSSSLPKSITNFNNWITTCADTLAPLKHKKASRS